MQKNKFGVLVFGGTFLFVFGFNIFLCSNNNDKQEMMMTVVKGEFVS